jgi:alpha-ketoglutaric semialdehyde dehydrogenase
MLSGLSIIGLEKAAEQKEKLYSFSTLQGTELPEGFSIASPEELETALSKAGSAFPIFSKLNADERAGFLDAIADEIIALGDVVVERAQLESGLPLPRLNGERDRTVNQLRMFANILREGSWIEAVIDTAQPDRKPLPRADIRKMQVALGPVAVFAASNFPFAFSTAGGDTASALAAGCPVIVKAHSAHLGANELMATAIQKAAKKTGMPDGVFSSLIGEGSSLGQKLAQHPAVKAIGFTGSFKAGMSLFRTAANDRTAPIPVYAEMSSINPVILLPGKIKADPPALAKQLAGSITLGVGQFCTNPGLLFLVNDENSAYLINELKTALAAVPAATMLNRTICASYYRDKQKISAIPGVTVLMENKNSPEEFKGSAALLQVSATDFINQPTLQEEVFGPASLVVLCNSHAEMLSALQKLHGQLTGSIYGEKEDFSTFADCISELSQHVGRIIYNNVPTGVEVCHAMIHGGPFPATTDSRATSVGGDAIKRFLRPVCFQDAPAEYLPAGLQNSNPLGIMRKLNGEYTRDAIV